jgi:hypothetical protein
LKRKHQKTGDFGEWPETALGAGGRAFKSPRPDQRIQADAGISQDARKSAVDKNVAVAFLKFQHAFVFDVQT